ncbi:MAG: hypothetical protein DMG58_37730 [Acidobacteria bacterium]|nr:MAG: hypothetical protein DMG58_37730 [Acidobacteriota bacterium]
MKPLSVPIVPLPSLMGLKDIVSAFAITPKKRVVNRNRFIILVAICGPYRFDAAVVEVLSEDNGIHSAGLEMRIQEKTPKSGYSRKSSQVDGEQIKD